MTLQEFENTLKSAHSIRELNQALADYLQSMRIDTYAYTYYSYYPTSSNKLKYEHSSSHLKLWHQHYIAEKYEDIDSTMKVVYQSTLPICWDLKQQLAKAKTPREKKMREDAIQYGVVKGVSIPIHGSLEDFAILLLVQRQHQTCLEKFSDLQYELFTAAYYFYDYMKNQLLKSAPAEEKNLLSVREMQCLTLLSQQYSLSAIANKLKITERTVNYHIQRLNKKLGTQNKYQSVMKALTQGLIKL